jgi:hypothetical protein
MSGWRSTSLWEVPLLQTPPSALWPSLPHGSILFHDSSISEQLRAEVEFNIRSSLSSDWLSNLEAVSGPRARIVSECVNSWSGTEIGFTLSTVCPCHCLPTVPQNYLCTQLQTVYNLSNWQTVLLNDKLKKWTVKACSCSACCFRITEISCMFPDHYFRKNCEKIAIRCKKPAALAHVCNRGSTHYFACPAKSLFAMRFVDCTCLLVLNGKCLMLWSPVVSIRTTCLTHTNSTFCPHCVFMWFVWIWEQTAIISLYSINWLVFITETECVYCAVRTEYLCVFVDLRTNSDYFPIQH